LRGQKTEFAMATPVRQITQEDPSGSTAAPEMEAVSAVDVRADDTPAQDIQPTADDISREAYLLHLARGGAHGSDLEDWLEAERRLRAGLTTR
jgi:hypothetical protein